jgi:flagellar protein FliJ
MYVFKLQSVLEYRKNIEEKIHNDFSEKKRELESEKLNLKCLIKERVDLIDEIRKMPGKKLYAEDIARHVAYIEKIREKEKQQKEIIERVKTELEIKRAELLDAVKKRKVMEKLKERHTEEYESNMGAIEQKNSDEMSVLKFGRREK